MENTLDRFCGVCGEPVNGDYGKPDGHCHGCANRYFEPMRTVEYDLSGVVRHGRGIELVSGSGSRINVIAVSDN